MSKRKNMGRGVERWGVGNCTESIPHFHVFHNTRLHFEFLPSLFFANFSSSVFLSFFASFLFLRFVFPFLVRSYKGLQKFMNKKLFAVKFTTLMTWQKVKVPKLFFIFLPYCCLQYVLHLTFQIPPPNLRHNYQVTLRMVKNRIVQFYRSKLMIKAQQIKSAGKIAIAALTSRFFAKILNSDSR